MASARNIFAFILMVQMSLVFADSDVYRSINSTNGDFMLQWKHNASASKLMFKITCQGTGWCGVGFTESADGRNMANYDIAVGGYASNAGYIKDYFSTAKSPPPADQQQNFTLTSASEEGGKTVVEFTRDDVTGDDKDVQFTVNKTVWVVWAFNTDTDAVSSITAKHSYGTTGRSTMKYDLTMATDASPTDAASNTTSASSTENDSPTQESSSDSATQTSTTASASIVGPSFAFCMLLVFKAYVIS